MNLLEEKICQTYGTARIFEKRAKDLSFKMKCLNFIGLGTPLIIGLIFLGFGEVNTCLKVFATILGILQASVFLWSIIDKWDDKYQYAILALRRQEEIHTALNLAKDDPSTPQNFIDKILENENRYSNEDITKDISDKEKRYAMRRTLFNYQLSCTICKKRPQTIDPPKSENCDNCSNY